MYDFNGIRVQADLISAGRIEISANMLNFSTLRESGSGDGGHVGSLNIQEDF